MPPPDPLSLQKFLADCGVCSRRAAEALIEQGQVLVNGQRAQLGQKVVPGVDQVEVAGQVIGAQAQARVTLVVNKPRGLICSNEDPHNPETVFSLVPRGWADLRFFCAGRLDKDSEGLVILTTDGDLAQRLMHPSNEVVKRYEVALLHPFPASLLPELIAGRRVAGEWLKVESATLIPPGGHGSSTEVDVAMHHGKKREIRELFRTLGFRVQRLRRYQIGALGLTGLPEGGARRLGPAEVERLFAAPRPGAA